ncbi:MAG TPA: exodeoxyribonuclease VII small subunit [Bacteroidetes bacterium]|nr:exodeoxyribonuclease VII small subunit [Bacteroidota bacterium]
MKQKSFEEAIQRLEKIVAELESGEIPLEESIKLFEEGMGLAKFCMDKLNQAEKKLMKLTKKGEDGFQLELLP